MTKKQTKTNDFKTVVVPAIITATSNKVSEDFQQETPTKTVYFHVTDAKKAKELEELGMTQYTTEDEEAQYREYFITKATKKVKLYTDKTTFVEKSFEIDIFDENTGLPTPNPNLYTQDLVHLAIVKVKGGKGKNDFCRLNAILLPSLDMLKEVEAVNPFADLFTDDVDLPF